MQTGADIKIQIRRMQASDFDVLERLVHAAYRGGEASVSWKNEHDIVSGARITQDGLKELLQSPDALVLVAERSAATAPAQNPELCGCVLIEKEIGRAHGVTVVIGMLAVGPNAQNLGLGRKLVEAAEAASREHFSATLAHMHVASVRSELLEWYRRLGYEATGETKPFPGPEVGIQPLRENLEFIVIEKKL